MSPKKWTADELDRLRRDWGNYSGSMTRFWAEWGEANGRTWASVKLKMEELDLTGAARNDLRAEQEFATYEQDDEHGFINVICASRRMLTKEEVIAQFRVDMTQWEVERFKVKTSEGYRKDRKVRWVVKDGSVLEGDVDDSGKMLVVPLYHIEVRFVRKTEEIRGRLALEDLIAEAKAAAPRFSPIKTVRSKDGMLYEIGMPDLHFGRLTWDEESGENYDIRIARAMVRQVLGELLGFAAMFKIERILLPLGNDFFNVNSREETTTHGTRQQEDTRWQKTFRAGRLMAVEMIDACAAVAPVDVVIMPGNHDEERIFYLGDALSCWYHATKRVQVDNRAVKRKYYTFGANLIGLTHGYYEKVKSLPALMPLEVPDLWAASRFREWHTGDKHHKEDLVHKTDENLGVVVRILRSLAPADAWTFDKGFVGALHAAEGFLWHPENGLQAQFTATPKKEPK
jgi:hypothetical protein